MPPEIEAWLVARLAGGDTAHVVSCPSTPVLWTAGKWAEWYPDAPAGRNPLGTRQGKQAWWSPGWRAQHDRLLAAVSSRRDRLPLFACGDLHATALGRILGSGELDLSGNPVVSLLTGAAGTKVGWPSTARGQRAVPSRSLRAEEWVPPIEENGFTLLDFTPEAARLTLFRWKPGDGEAALDHLDPFQERTFVRPAAIRAESAGPGSGSART